MSMHILVVHQEQVPSCQTSLLNHSSCIRGGTAQRRRTAGLLAVIHACRSDPLYSVDMAQALQAAQLQRVMIGDKQYPKPSDLHPSYGTAGFRSVADRLPSTVYRYLNLTRSSMCSFGRLCFLNASAALSYVTTDARGVQSELD